MKTVRQALQLVNEQAYTSRKEVSVPVADALGHIIAEDIYAPISLPAFRQSNMDGYAVRFRESVPLTYNLVGEVKAGDAINPEMQPGEAIRIFTGARVPDTADAVVIQEKCTSTDIELTIEEAPRIGQYIRPIGGQILKGSIALKRGHYITPASIGVLKSLGIEKIQIYNTLEVAIIVTGNELVQAGNPLADGQIYESNSAVLKAALHQHGIEGISLFFAKDTLEDTENTLRRAFEQSDLVLISGGISVGDYDFVGTALQNLNVKEFFYKVHQKPGKPLYFGKKEDTYVFALPGNPASTLTCFYVYVTVLIDILVGNVHSGLLRVHMPIAAPFKNTFNRALFLKARINTNAVEILDHQHSSTIISFAEANALVYIPEEMKHIEKGTLVETLILPYGSSN